ncbi:helix-turn-helix domain-containing protein [Caulobacter mirabilis]|uniref:Transcriptional regulator n=1 Tax=Caulobacter mirabilis TaxID=69666 RepID=A0A2D2AU18_9CAUL|nr:helix-turn-helix transcriptional regulator [Caulobacter mirabilis]ATQ41496.1 transcriptional regulator [Caulobacter mirabilis]
MGIIVRGPIVHILASLATVDKTVLKTLGRRVREKRKSLSWSQEELAHRADIDRSYIGGVERGVRNLSFSVLCQICRALECDVAELTHGIPEL